MADRQILGLTTGLGDEALERGRLLFAQECRFVWGSEKIDSMPPPGLPEVCFAGRSNVGKSSLVNALTGRKTLARVSHTPGRTQQLNFFNLGDRLMLVDLPGYGYAQVSKQKVAVWNDTIRAYLKGRVPLRRVCVLVDSRHGLKSSDKEVMDLLDSAAVAYQIVLTKADKPKSAELEAVKASIQAALKKRPAANPDIAVTSSHKGDGVAELRASLAMLAEG